MRKVMIVLSLFSYAFLSNHCAAQTVLTGRHDASHSVKQERTEAEPCHHENKTREPYRAHACGSELFCCNTLDILVPSHVALQDPSFTVLNFLTDLSPIFIAKPTTLTSYRDHGPPGPVVRNNFSTKLSPRAPPLFA